MIEFKDLWYGHPINESVQTPCLAPQDLTNLEGRPIKKNFPVFSNQCAIRMGIALRRAGVQPAPTCVFSLHANTTSGLAWARR